MPSSSVGVQVAKRMQKIEREVRGSSRAAVDSAAKVMQNSIHAEIERVAPGRTMSGLSRGKGGKVGVRYDVKGNKNPTALIKAAGPLHLLDNPTKPHRIFVGAQRARGRGSTRINRQNRLDQAFGGVGAFRHGTLKLRDGNFRRVVNHPGTRGHRTFNKGLDRGRPKALDKLRDVHVAALKRGFSR